MLNEFHSREELLKRIYPALEARFAEMIRLGYSDITIVDMWNYLSMKWKYGNDLMLSDIVDDIMKVEYDEIKLFLDEKNEVTEESFEQ